ncbi:MAG: hypothetical protein R2752_11905 [Vicinamibacterales bacterium]
MAWSHGFVAGGGGRLGRVVADAVAALVVLGLAVTLAACDEPGTRAYSHGVDVGDAARLADARAGAGRLRSEFGDGWAATGLSSQTSRGPAGETTRQTTTQSWHGDAFGVPDLKVVLLESDAIGEGPEVEVRLSARISSSEVEQQFRALEAHVREVFLPASVR